MSSTTPNIGLTKTTAAETIGQQWAASNDSGGNFDIIDTKMGAVGSQSVQAQLDALNSNLSLRTFNSSNYAEGATQQITLPANFAVGQAYLVIFRHYTSSTTFTADLMLLCPISDSSVATAWIAKNSSATLSSTSISGKVVTFTFSATAYCSIYFIKAK